MSTENGSTAASRRVTLLTRAGCSSCDAAKVVLAEVLSDVGFAPGGYEVIDVDAVAGTDPELRAEYGDRVPVVLVDGVEHSYWTVDEVRLRRDLTL